MARVGFIGLGKLGLPVAATMAAVGLEVYGYDPAVKGPPIDTSYEEGLGEALHAAGSRLHFCDSLQQVDDLCPVKFCAVQTPHEPEFEGITPLPEGRADFSYEALRSVAREISNGYFVVISTVLPGTMRREIVPLLGDYVKLVYNPSFIAMGTTIQDYLHPEFVLIGGDDGMVANIYADMEIGPVRHMSIESAELTKVAYNVAIGQKLVLANAVMEISHKLGADADDVSGALAAADRRIASGAYLRGGMGDGGACHPRDQIALSWLARELPLSCDPFSSAMEHREAQTGWLIDLMDEHDLPKAIIGVSYKPHSRLTAGSPALLAASMILERGDEVRLVDPYARGFANDPPAQPYVFLHGCDHGWYPGLAKGSVVIDPWRTWPDQEGVKVVRVGE